VVQNSHGEIQQHYSAYEAVSGYQDVVRTPATEKSAASVEQRVAPVEADSTPYVYELAGHQRGELP
jgi:hypothetical protein